jgi:hypothetical protein
VLIIFILLLHYYSDYIIVDDPLEDNSQSSGRFSKLQRDFYRAFLSLLPKEEIISRGYECKDIEDASVYHPDMILFADNCEFYCHRFLLCGRSDFFNAMINGNFAESINKNSLENSLENQEDVPKIRIGDISSHVFAILLEFLYSHSMNMENSYEVGMEVMVDILFAADRLLMVELKQYCATIIIQYIQENNVFELFKIAKFFSLSRLEFQCTRFLAIHLEDMLHRHAYFLY